MQKKILSKTAREYLQASLPENLFPIRKLRNTNKKLTFYKNRFSKIKVIRAKNEIFNQYASSIKNIFVKSAVNNQKLLVVNQRVNTKVVLSDINAVNKTEQSLILNNISLYNPSTLNSNPYRIKNFISKGNNQFEQPAVLSPFTFSIDQIQYELAKRKARCSDFKNQLKERKKLALIYGLLSKKYIRKTIKQACLLNGKKSDNFFFLLEKRLDVVLFKACFFMSIKSARQWINHGKILVNNKCVNTCSFLLSPGDIISIKQKDRILLCKKIKYSLKRQILKKKRVITLKQQYRISVISMALFSKLKNSLNFLKLSQLFISTLNNKSKVSKNSIKLNKLKKSTTTLSETLKKDEKANFSYQHFISQVKKIVNFKLKDVNKKLKSVYAKSLSLLDELTLTKNLIELNLVKTKNFPVNSISNNLKKPASNGALDKKFVQSLRAFITHLKLKKIFCKNYKKRYNYSILYQNTLKPINLEISYKNLVIIYLYSPQKISFPCSVDISLIVRSLA